MGLRIFALVHLLSLLISRKLKSLPYVFDNKNKILVSLPYESWEGRSQFLNCFPCWLIDSSLTDFKRNISSAQKSWSRECAGALAWLSITTLSVSSQVHKLSSELPVWVLPHTALVKQCGECWAWLSLSHRVVSNTEEESSEPKASWSLTHGGRLDMALFLLCTHVCWPSLSTQSPWWREGSKEQQLLALPPDSRADVLLRARQASCWRHCSGTHGDKPVYYTISLINRVMARMTSPLT